PQLRGRSTDATADRSDVATETLVSSFELFRQAIVARDERAKQDATARFRPIVATWLRRDPWWSGTDAAAEQLADRALDQFWAASTRRSTNRTSRTSTARSTGSKGCSRGK